MADDKYKIQKIDDYRWRIPREGKMRVDGIVYADKHMLEEIQKDESLQQVINVSYLPGDCKPFAGNARHPLGIWVSHRRRGCV